MKVWVTKYALTTGIMEIEVCQPIGMLDLVKYQPSGCIAQYFHKEGNEWHRTEEAAKLRAEEMRSKKIKSLEKSLEKLKKKKF